MNNSIESTIKKAVDEILEKRAFEATQLRAERHERFDDVEKIFQSILQCDEDREENVNAVIAFWQEQAYMQGLEDSQHIQSELSKYGVN